MCFRSPSLRQSILRPCLPPRRGAHRQGEHSPPSFRGVDDQAACPPAAGSRPTDGPDRLLSTAVGWFFLCSHRSLLVDNDEPELSLIQMSHCVQLVLTPNSYRIGRH